MPRSGQSCPYSSLARTALDLLCRPQKANNFRPPVESKVLRAGGSQNGVRLIKLSSLLGYLNSLPVARPKPKEAKLRRAS